MRRPRLQGTPAGKLGSGRGGDRGSGIFPQYRTCGSPGRCAAILMESLHRGDRMARMAPASQMPSLTPFLQKRIREEKEEMNRHFHRDSRS